MGLTPRNFEVLSILNRTGFPPTVREIGQELGVSSTSAVQRHIDRLVELGLVERRGVRRRVTLLGKSALRERELAA